MTEDFSSIKVTARTHPPGYSFHKYWARKPHNVVRRALEACCVRPGDLVVDPFCGSGVPLSEAAALGATCVGFDVNPIAVELTRATLGPPDADAYRDALGRTLNDLEREFGDRYRSGGRRLRYAVHATVVICRSCGARISADVAARRGRAYACPRCDARLSFNLESLVATRQLKSVFEDGSEVSSNLDQEAPRDRAPPSPFDHAFAPNGRVLAFRGMRTRHLFTARNFELLAAFAERVSALPPELRAAARLTLTASVAQCSRLIAYRNELRTGGPAWTVPGFWVPPLHLETNPLLHLRARLKRSHRAFQHLQRLGGRGAQHLVERGDAGDLLAAGLPGGARAAVAFLDPPYGDSVPYLEFSALWNSFLGEAPDPAADLSVSDRARGDATWDSYERSLARIAGALRAAMRDDGRVIVTFNNKDMRAWRALLLSLQRAGFRCQGAFYQHPAVVSAKAQLAQGGSYVGDVYGLFGPSTERPSPDTAAVARALQRALGSDPGAAPDDAALQRVAITAFLRANVDAATLPEVPTLLAEARRLAIGGPSAPREPAPR